ncbi:PadR family transcriptional regulator [Streptomyces antibioticus]|uniref:PadR family transcriptional regulator n=1 Tax=Streptomyces antibioticus TaxID=1890 RepID=UPI00340A1D59
MSLRHAVLGLLVQRPSTGYELAKLFDRSLMTAWHARHSQIYPELTKLESRGFVEVASEGPRSSRTWRITREGREELRAWLVEKEPSRIQRNESAVRLFFAGMLAPGDRQVACERDLAYVNEQIRMLEETREQVLAATPPQYFLPTIELGLRVNAVYRDWLQEQIDQAEHEAGEIHD